MLLLPMGSGNISFLRESGNTSEAQAPDTRLHSNWVRALVRPAHPAAIFCIRWDPTTRLVKRWVS